MKNVENRLASMEKIAAKTEIVQVTFKDNESAQMDLLKAVNLFLKGEVYCIKSILKPGEQRKYLNDTIAEIEKFINEGEL